MENNLNVEEIVNENIELVGEEPTKTKKKATKGVAKKDIELSWKEQFIENYEGRSAESKLIEQFLKTNYKGNFYIPWAVMERLVYMQDPNAEFINITNEFGGLVHSDMLTNKQFNRQKDIIVSETEASMLSHFVKVQLVFKGKVFTEDYPVQDKDYSAARIYDQNLVNKALQRARTKVASRATGIGLKLYEGFDLQFDTPVEEVKPKLESDVKPTPIVKEEPKVVKEEPKIVVGENESNFVVNNNVSVVDEPKVVEPTNPDIVEFIEMLRNGDAEKVDKALQTVNVSVMRKYNFAISRTDEDNSLVEKLSKFPNVKKFKETVGKLMGD